MNKKSFNKRSRLLFKHFTRKNYALFNCLGREVLIGMLSVSTLSNAKANGICVKTELTGDSLQRKEVRLDEVIVPGSRAPLAALQSPVIVEVITREDIQRAEASSVNDILKLATGVDVRQRGGFGVQTDISINGGTFDQITILLNGTNISNPQTGHNASDFPVSVNDIERIEILEGASSRILGNAAFNGAINIVTKQSYPSASGSSTPQLSSYIELEGGSYGTLTAGAGTNVLAGNLSNYLSGGYTRSDGGTENSDFEKGRIFYKGGWNDNRQNRFRLDYQLGASTQSYGANTFYSAKYNNQYEKTEHLMASLGGTVNLGTDDRGIQLKPAIYYNHFNDHYQLIRHEEGAAKGENYHWLDILGASFNANINWLVVGQPGIDMKLRILKSFFVKYERRLPELVEDFCQYYLPFKRKEVVFCFDATFVGNNFGVDKNDFHTVIKHCLMANGWTVREIYIGRPWAHPVKNALINRMFVGQANYTIMINEENNTDLLVSIDSAMTVNSTNQKDKSGEKKPETEEDRLETRTDGSDAFDTLCIAVETGSMSGGGTGGGGFV